MTTYAKVDNGVVTSYPYTYLQLQADNPNTSYPKTPSVSTLEAFGVFAVTPVARPAYDLTMDVSEGTPVLLGGVWTQVWVETPASAADIAERTAANKDQDERDALSVDAFVSTFVGLTPAEVEAYVENNVTTMADAKDFMKKLGKMMLLLARKEYT